MKDINANAFGYADIDAAIVEFAGNRLSFAFVDHVSVDVADRGETYENAGAVVVAQTALDIVLAV